jgi:predicted transcriptional regulator
LNLRGAIMARAGANRFGTSKAATNEATLAVLKALASGRASMQELMNRLQMDVVELARTVSGMREAGLIELEGSGANQTATLTKTGTALLKIGMK